MTDELPARPGWVPFTAVLLVLVGFFSIVFAIITFSDAAWLADLKDGIGGSGLWISGIIDLVIAAGCFYAAYSLLQGGIFGFWFGLLFAGINAIKWFFLIFFNPMPALIFLAIDLLIIYGLVKSADYFDEYKRLGIGG
jgi:hypothetical protein